MLIFCDASGVVHITRHGDAPRCTLTLQAIATIACRYAVDPTFSLPLRVSLVIVIIIIGIIISLPPTLSLFFRISVGDGRLQISRLMSIGLINYLID